MKSTRLSLIATLLSVALGACASESSIVSESSGPVGTLSVDEAFNRAKAQLAEYEASHGRIIEGRRGPVHFLEWGEQGLPLVWLHGTYSSSYEFTRVAEALASEGRRIVAIDWYGHGLTPLPDVHVRMADAVAEVAGVMDALGLERAVLGGWSRGGGIAAAFHAAHPERVLGLVLVDGGSWSLRRFTSTMSEAEVQKFMAGLHDPVSGELALPVYSTERDLFAAASERERTKSGVSTLGRLAALATLAKAERNPSGRWVSPRHSVLRWLGQYRFDAAVRGMIDPTAAPPFFRDFALQEPLADLALLSVPALVIDPTGDSMDMTGQNRELAAAHPGRLTLKLYEDTGHNVLDGQPDRFLNDLRAFIATILEGGE